MLKNILNRIKCLCGYHREHTSFSWKNGHYATHCKTCGKTLGKG